MRYGNLDNIFSNRPEHLGRQFIFMMFCVIKQEIFRMLYSHNMLAHVFLMRHYFSFAYYSLQKWWLSDWLHESCSTHSCTYVWHRAQYHELFLKSVLKKINNNIFEEKVSTAMGFFQITLSPIKLKTRPFCERTGEIILEAMPNLFCAICYTLLFFHCDLWVPEWMSPDVLQFWGQVNKWQPLVQLCCLPVLEKSWLKCFPDECPNLWAVDSLPFCFSSANLIVDYWNNVIISRKPGHPQKKW